MRIDDSGRRSREGRDLKPEEFFFWMTTLVNGQERPVVKLLLFVAPDQCCSRDCQATNQGGYPLWELETIHVERMGLLVKDLLRGVLGF